MRRGDGNRKGSETPSLVALSARASEQGPKNSHSSIFRTRTEPHLASSATVLELSTGTNNRLDDRGSFPMSTRRRILGPDGGFASRGGGGGGGEGPVISTPAFLALAIAVAKYWQALPCGVCVFVHRNRKKRPEPKTKRPNLIVTNIYGGVFLVCFWMRTENRCVNETPRDPSWF